MFKRCRGPAVARRLLAVRRRPFARYRGAITTGTPKLTLLEGRSSCSSSRADYGFRFWPAPLSRSATILSGPRWRRLPTTGRSSRAARRRAVRPVRVHGNPQDAAARDRAVGELRRVLGAGHRQRSRVARGRPGSRPLPRRRGAGLRRGRVRDRRGAYVAQSGDTLAGIAGGLGITIGDLSVANGNADPDVFHAGRTLYY